MEFLRNPNTQKRVKAILGHLDEDTQKLAGLVAVGIMERNTDHARLELLDVIKRLQDGRDILARLQSQSLKPVPVETKSLVIGYDAAGNTIRAEIPVRK